MRFALFVHTYPAASSPLVPHTNAMWASARSVKVVEVWAASPGSFRRAFELWTGLATLAESRAIVGLPIETDGLELRAGSTMSTCRADAAFAPDKPQAALDQSLATRICAGRGRFRWDGKAFARVK